MSSQTKLMGYKQPDYSQIDIEAPQGSSQTGRSSGVVLSLAVVALVVCVALGAVSLDRASTASYAATMTSAVRPVAGTRAQSTGRVQANVVPRVNQQPQHLARAANGAAASTVQAAPVEQLVLEEVADETAFVGEEQAETFTQSLVSQWWTLALAAGAMVSAFIAGRHTSTGKYAMMATASELRSRIKSVNNSKKITDAMNLVAAAKLRRAQELVLVSRPFNEALQGVFGTMLDSLRETNDELALDHPLMTMREVKTVTLVVIGGDRGLCGGFNAKVIKEAIARYDALKKQGLNVQMITIGKKMTTFFKPKGYNIVREFECNIKTFTPREVERISDELIAEYISGETDTVEILYTKFISLVSSEPSQRSLLPLQATDIAEQHDEIYLLTTKEGKFDTEKVEFDTQPRDDGNLMFDQDPDTILEALMPLYLNSQLVRMIQESLASELANRMQSMKTASDNAKELGKSLTTEFNRKRQAAITSQICEIVAGANA